MIDMIDLSKLNEEQLKLAKKVSIIDSIKKFKTVAGCDQVYIGNNVISAIVICDYESMEVIESKHAAVEGKFHTKVVFCSTKMALQLLRLIIN